MNKEAQRIIDNTDFTKFDTWYYPQNLLEEFEIFDSIDIDDSYRLKKHWFHSWICTDTQVGIAVYTLDDLVVCISFKQYRKAYEEYWFVSKERGEVLRKYLYSLINKEEVDYRLTDEIPNLDETIKLTEHKRFEKINEIIIEKAENL